MKKDIRISIRKIINNHKHQKRWKKVINILSCIAIFLTIYILIAPALTITNTTYTFHLIDNFIGNSYTWKQQLGVTTSYDLKLHYVDTENNYIEGTDLTLELGENTKYKNVAYGLGYIPQNDGITKGIDLISEFNLKTKTTNNGNKYEFDHVEVLIENTWYSFYSNMESSQHYSIYCYNANYDDNNEIIKNFNKTDTSTIYGWRGNYEVPSTTDGTTTYKATSYKVTPATEYKIVYKLVMNGNDSIISSVSSDSGITFKLFNYEGDNTETGVNANGLYNYFTFRGIGSTDKNINQEIDADGFTYKRAKVKTKLNENNNPIFDCQTQCDNDSTLKNTSLGYLFGEETNAKGSKTIGVNSYSPVNTPLQKKVDDNGIEYYYYDSNSNAVDYDIQNRRFIVRNYKERSYNMTTYTDEANRYEFLPFNYWTNTTLIGANNRTYQHESSKVDHWYGMTMEFEFYMPKDGLIKENAMKFEFSGDDDVWVFIDNVLVLDLGGTHGSVDGSIDFSTGNVEASLNWNGTTSTKNTTTIYDAFKVANAIDEIEWNSNKPIFKDYKKHTLKFFYLERGASVANCKIKFNIPVLPPGSLSVQKSFIDEDKYNENHEFTLYNITDTKVAVPNTKYTIGGVEYYTDEFGKFTLKNNEVATFKLTNFQNYYVEETTPGNHSVSYSCTLDGEECPIINKTNSITINPDSTYQAIFTNKIKTFNLNISKITYNINQEEYDTNNDSFEFEIRLKDKNNIPVDIPDDLNSLYIVNHEEGIVTFNLKSKQSITIYDIPIDTNITLKETKHDGYQTIMKKTEDDYVINNGDTYEFIITSNKDITIHNIPGIELPNTGGKSILTYLIIGTILILISINIYLFKLKEGDQ